MMVDKLPGEHAGLRLKQAVDDLHVQFRCP